MKSQYDVKYILIGLALISNLLCLDVKASEQAERLYLIQLVNQLDEMKPLIIAASKQQPKTNRILFPYIAYRDANHKLHPGLLEEINQIQKTIQIKLDRTLAEPAVLPSVQGDTIALHHHTSQG